jgi:formate hydrogenlyase transcriptional activator
MDKTPDFLEILNDFQSLDSSDNEQLAALLKKASAYEKGKNILLALGNDITKLREKNDLINLFSSRLKSLFYFTHTIVMLIDHSKEKYAPFLLDNESSMIKNHPEYPDAIKAAYDLNHPIIKPGIDSKEPTLIRLKDITSVSKLPSYIRLNFECGVHEMLITPLVNKMETIGFILIFSDRPESFSEEFKQIMKGIAPQLSNAVENITINEQVTHKHWVNSTLLELSTKMVSIRSRGDLLKVINIELSKVIKFTHSMMTVTDAAEKTYNAFLIDEESRTNEFSKYTEALAIPYPVNDGIYDVAARSGMPEVFNLRSINMAIAPLWLKLNYAAGAREMMIKVLPGNEENKHSLILFADHSNAFNPASLNIIERISSQLSTAATNIYVNEEILRKEKDKSFLLDFSNDLAAVKNKEELTEAVRYSLSKLNSLKGFVVRLVNEDQTTLTTYIHDGAITAENDPLLKVVTNTRHLIKDGIQERVLQSESHVMINIDEEIRRGRQMVYLRFWKNMNFQNMIGIRLRSGNSTLGLLWLGIEEINVQLLKGICEQLSTAISNIINNDQVLAYKQKLEVENNHLKEQLQTVYNFSEIIGNGPEMQKVYRLMSRVTESGSTVLILGETGTGKELIARAIHNASSRKGNAMIKVNCAAMPANLIESELFGHEKGAFTGAYDRRIGKFELADNSTLFLDEIGEMPLESQVKLLRVIQERELERIGGKTTIKVNVRIIAATNRNLETEVKTGRFRSDLFYRLNVFPISLPPLRNRMQDIEPLAQFFIAKYSKQTGIKVTGIAPKIIQQLRAYLWPGNIRELEHLIERSILLASDTILREVHLPKSKNDNNAQIETVANRTLEEFERDYIIAVLKRCSGKVAGEEGAAALLDVPSTTLHSKMKKLNISKGDYYPRT